MSAKPPTDEQILALRARAEAAGDELVLCLADIALTGSTSTALLVRVRPQLTALAPRTTQDECRRVCAHLIGTVARLRGAP